MPRVARVISTTGYYHVIMRGQNKEYIFKSEVHKEYFMKSVATIEKDEQLSIVAWCLMDNHVHLVIKTEPEILAIAFKRLNIKYAMYYHRSNKSLGHVFQDRFKSEPIESDEYLMRVIRYVHNNPIKARMIKKLEAYRWSSYNDYLNQSLNKEQQFAMTLFDNNKESFKYFHRLEDDREYLEIKEDQLQYRKERGQNIVNNFCNKHGIHDSEELHKDQLKLKELLIELSEKSGLSKRQIASEYGLSISRVQSYTKDVNH